MSLLNLKQQLFLYGSIRNVWEGGYQGEGFLRFVKTELKSGLNKSWQTWLIDNLQTNCAYEEVLRKNSESNRIKSFSSKHGNVKVYPNLSDALYTVLSSRPFVASDIRNANGKFPDGKYVLYNNQKKIYGIQIVRSEFGFYSHGMLYHQINFDESVDHVNISDNDVADHGNESFSSINFDVSLLYLPQLGINGLPKRSSNTICYYTCVRSDWKVDS
jgi:hypothetical protein